MLFVISQRSLLQITQLLEHDDGCNNQYDGNGKLGNDQNFSERNITCSDFEQSL